MRLYFHHVWPYYGSFYIWTLRFTGPHISELCVSLDLDLWSFDLSATGLWVGHVMPGTFTWTSSFLYWVKTWDETDGWEQCIMGPWGGSVPEQWLEGLHLNAAKCVELIEHRHNTANDVGSVYDAADAVELSSVIQLLLLLLLLLVRSCLCMFVSASASCLSYPGLLYCLPRSEHKCSAAFRGHTTVSCWLAHHPPAAHELGNTLAATKSSATVDGPRDAPCQSKSCQPLRSCRNKLCNKSRTDRSNGVKWLQSTGV